VMCISYISCEIIFHVLICDLCDMIFVCMCECVCGLCMVYLKEVVWYVFYV